MAVKAARRSATANGGAVGVAVVGCGVIGSAVCAALLLEGGTRGLLRRRSGVTVMLRHVVERDQVKAAEAGIPRKVMTADFGRVLTDPATQVVVELIGGLEPARTFVLQALRAGKHVVTANKYLLAVHGREIFAAAKRAGRCVQFEASCGGAIPIIGALTESLLANEITRVVGIVNGTCNYILTQMTRNGESYADALAGAQAAGFAERDPTFDVNGTDSAHKLAILSSLAFGVDVPLEEIEVSGIDRLCDVDLRFAKEFGYVCKLLAIGEKVDARGEGGGAGAGEGALSLCVHPTFVKNDQLLANVHGSFNAISVAGHAAGETVYFGRGAGGKPTSSAVISDILEIGLGTAPLLFARLPLLTKKAPGAFVARREAASRNYLRVTALDVPGVMGRVANILSGHGISLAGINQHESQAGAAVPIVIMTHGVKEGDVAEAMKEIDALEGITARTVRIRVLG